MILTESLGKNILKEIAYSILQKMGSGLVCSFVFKESRYVIPNTHPLCEGTSPFVDEGDECFFSVHRL